MSYRQLVVEKLPTGCAECKDPNFAYGLICHYFNCEVAVLSVAVFVLHAVLRIFAASMIGAIRPASGEWKRGMLSLPSLISRVR